MTSLIAKTSCEFVSSPEGDESYSGDIILQLVERKNVAPYNISRNSVMDISSEWEFKRPPLQGLL